MRRDRERLSDILEALDSLEQIVANTTEPEFLSSDLHYHAVAQLLTVVGEAASRVSPELRERFCGHRLEEHCRASKRAGPPVFRCVAADGLDGRHDRGEDSAPPDCENARN